MSSANIPTTVNHQGGSEMSEPVNNLLAALSAAVAAREIWEKTARAGLDKEARK